MKTLSVLTVCALLGLTACGQSDLERTATGAVIGGAAGATCRSLGTCPNN